MVFKLRQLNNHQAHPLPPGQYVIGRADDVNFQIKDASVSRHHARIINAEGMVWIEDLKSSNGTAYKGKLIQEKTQISINDVVHCGDIAFRLEPEIREATSSSFNGNGAH